LASAIAAFAVALAARVIAPVGDRISISSLIRLVLHLKQPRVFNITSFSVGRFRVSRDPAAHSVDCLEAHGSTLRSSVDGRPETGSPGSDDASPGIAYTID
jgi:hypothetical protein